MIFQGEYIKVMTNTCHSVEEAIKLILSNLIDQPVQILFSGKGRLQKRKGKQNFTATQLYNIMSGNIILVFIV